MYSQFYPTDLDNWKIWEVQSDSKAIFKNEDYVTMHDGMDDMLVEAVQELAVEKPVEDEVVEDVVVEDETVDVVVEDETEDPPSVADVTMRAETDEALKVWANEQGGASLPHIPSSGEYFYLY